MTGALQRVGQFWRHASAVVSPADRARAEALLGSSLAPFFFQLPVNDQRHGIDVLHTLLRLHPQAGRVLQQAALLHDAGKLGARFSVIDRSLAVLLKSMWPGSLRMFVRLVPNFGARLEVYEDHARLGAERLRAAGAPELAAIVEEHHSAAPRLELTRRLQEADRRN
jgi:hypothetical protein